MGQIRRDLSGTDTDLIHRQQKARSVCYFLQLEFRNSTSHDISPSTERAEMQQSFEGTTLRFQGIFIFHGPRISIEDFDNRLPTPDFFLWYRRSHGYTKYYAKALPRVND